MVGTARIRFCPRGGILACASLPTLPRPKPSAEDHRKLQCAALLQHFRVIRYDQRGHGASSVPPGPYSIAELGHDAIALLDGLGIARAHAAQGDKDRARSSYQDFLSLWKEADPALAILKHAKAEYAGLQ